MDSDLLASVASQLVENGGILASDESPTTLGKRLVKAGLENDEETRCAWRSCLYGANLSSNGIRGCIVYEEAFDQKVPGIYLEKEEEEKVREGRAGEVPVPALLLRQRVLVGVKADAGLAPFEGPDSVEGDTVTRGLERLPEACARWRAQGASFTKWRSALAIRERRPPPDSSSGPESGPSFGVSTAAVAANAEQLARYAAVSQAHGLVPLIEPELLIDGAHSAEDAARALKEVLTAVFAAIEKVNREAAAAARAPAAAAAAAAGNEQGKPEKEGPVSLRGLLLKLMPCVPGADSTPADPAAAPPSDERLARLTLGALRECVPAEVPGVVLLSGGLSERRATEVLQAINAEKLKAPSLHPWAISFSFGRALQASSMRLWGAGRRRGRTKGGAGEGGEEEERASIAAARAAVEASSEANREASLGAYRGPHPAADADAADLREGFRGYRDDAVARAAGREAAEAAGAKEREEPESGAAGAKERAEPESGAAAAAV